MSSFTTPAQVELLPSFKFKLLAEFVYHEGALSSDINIITVPAGFVTDLASIPRIFWNIMPPDGEYAKASIIHDYMYSKHLFHRKHCDEILYEAMGVLGVQTWKKYIIYSAVRMFGWAAWNRVVVPPPA
jgi:hypothetical protein